MKRSLRNILLTTTLAGSLLAGCSNVQHQKKFYEKPYGEKVEVKSEQVLAKARFGNTLMKINDKLYIKFNEDGKDYVETFNGKPILSKKQDGSYEVRVNWEGEKGYSIYHWDKNGDYYQEHVVQ